MKIKLSPVRMDDQLSASVDGDKITINGEVFDFAPLQEGAILPADAVQNDWIMGDVRRIYGEIHLTLRLPHGMNAPHETRFPAAFYEAMTVTNGPVPLPPYDAASEAEPMQLLPEQEVTP
ncbi:hypothetical protein [Aeromonas caviae]|uniref:hypothetical protein n=1 Tax=Aeromonas caviae TaxID=648 RepID=UPI003F745DC1